MHAVFHSPRTTFQNLIDGTGQNKNGYTKIRFCAQQAENDGLRHFWVDTCCINKADHVELQEAINSMFRWYQQAALCYVCLPDVSSLGDFARSEWFTRGWTLQELLAPRVVEFYTSTGAILGTRTTLRGHRSYPKPVTITMPRSSPKQRAPCRWDENQSRGRGFANDCC